MTGSARVRRRWLWGLAALVGLAALDALWVEPRLMLRRERVALPVGARPLRLAHLADLHLASADSLLARRLVRGVAAARPDVVVVSGDWVHDVRRGPAMGIHTRAAAAVAAELRRTAPVLSVQGHSDYMGETVALLARAGVEWLSNEGRAIGPPGGGVLLLGLNQQVGHDAGEARPRMVPLRIGDRWAIGRRLDGLGTVNHYLSWDPVPRGLGDAGGAMAWSGYEASVAVWVDGTMDAGLAVHSRYALGEDRFVRLGGGGDSPPEPAWGFRLLVNGSAPTAGQLETGVVPAVRRWYRLRVRTTVRPDALRVEARAWPEGEAEPARWQAWLEDRSPGRARAGTVALWTQGGGTAAFRDLRVTAADGRPLLAAPFDGPRRPAGWRDGTRGTRLALALARSPRVPPGTPRIVLTHSPDPAREAAARGLEAVLAGHTHGGQVRLPGLGALVTRTRLGRRYDRGLFRLPGDGEGGIDGGVWLYLNPGVGTSLLPIRFFDPPGWALVTFEHEGASGARRR